MIKLLKALLKASFMYLMVFPVAGAESKPFGEVIGSVECPSSTPDKRALNGIDLYKQGFSRCGNYDYPKKFLFDGKYWGFEQCQTDRHLNFDAGGKYIFTGAKIHLDSYAGQDKNSNYMFVYCKYKAPDATINVKKFSLTYGTNDGYPKDTNLTPLIKAGMWHEKQATHRHYSINKCGKNKKGEQYKDLSTEDCAFKYLNETKP